MARIIVNSNRSDGIVKKLVYQTRGPYTVIERVSLGTYDCRKYGKPDGTIKKFRTEDLYLPPPDIFPCESTDSTDLCYLNNDFAPLHHPFTKDFNIEAYNTRWFDEEPTLPSERLLLKSPAIHNEDDNILALLPGSIQTEPIAITTDIIPVPIVNPSPAESTLSQFPPVITDIVEFTTDDESPIDSTPMSAAILFKSISNSVDKLFFVCYTPAETLRPRWYLVQVNLA